MGRRQAGLLLHPTSLTGGFGIGDLGPAAEDFLTWARAAGQTVWQVLPLGPPEPCGSPYNSRSSFAGSPLLISPRRLLEDGLLEERDLEDSPPEGERVDFEVLVPWKDRLLRQAWQRFAVAGEGPAALRSEFDSFCRSPRQRYWLEDWAVFAALRELYGRAGWWRWPQPLAERHGDALAAFREAHAGELDFHRFVQFLFFRQWRRLHSRAGELGIEVLGDLPIYVALDSCDVWAHRELFELDAEGRPQAVAGVPPDAFSASGQRWGNPLYRWPEMATDGYRWWSERLAASLRLVDRLRLDHFRGFEAYWRVPADAATAREGQWVRGPGDGLFTALRSALGELPLVAENLGVITPAVEKLRRRYGWPGMAVLQFAFAAGDQDRIHAPHRLEPATVVYTGTHDNDTTAGWYASLPPEDRRRVELYSGARDGEVPWALLRLAYTSVAELAVVPVQDLLGLGSEARMNVPAVAEGNWRWRLSPGALTAELAHGLSELAWLTERHPGRDGG